VSWVRRFSRTERTLHWVNAAGFFLLLVTGLILYLPRLSILVGRRPTVKDIHYWGGIGWISALVLVAVLGDRRGLLRATSSGSSRAGSTSGRRSTRS
jgi:cytochrome b subunit of formate dehydrogenase